MSKMKHTPGQWTYGGPVQRDSPAVRAYPSLPKEYYEIGLAPTDSPPAIATAWKEADACLIAASPALLAACKAVVNHSEPNGYCLFCSKQAGDHDSECVLQLVFEALDKAEYKHEWS